MLNFMKKYNKTEDGFTLVELLVVIIIIGILVAIAIPIFMEQQKAAIAAAVKSDARNSVNAVQEALIQEPNASDILVYSTGESKPATSDGQVAVQAVESDGNFVVVVDPADAGNNAKNATSHGSAHGYVLHAESSVTGYWYEYDSTTGLWSDGTSTDSGDADGPDGNPGGDNNGGGATVPPSAISISGGGHIHPDYEMGGVTQGAYWQGGGSATAEASSALPAFTHPSFQVGTMYPLSNVKGWIGGVEVPINAGESYIVGGPDGSGYSFALMLGSSSNYDFIVGDGRNVTSRHFFANGTISFTANGQSGNVIKIVNSPGGFEIHSDHERDRKWKSTVEVSSVSIYEGSSESAKTMYFYSIYVPDSGVSPSNLSSMPIMSSATHDVEYPITSFSGTYENGSPITFAHVPGNGGTWGTVKVEKNGSGKVTDFEINPYFAELVVAPGTDNTAARNSLEGATITFTANGQTNTFKINRNGTGMMDQSVSDYALDILSWQ